MVTTVKGLRFVMRDVDSDAAKLRNERSLAISLVASGERVATGYKCSFCETPRVMAVAITNSGNIQHECRKCKRVSVYPRDAFAPQCAHRAGDAMGNTALVAKLIAGYDVPRELYKTTPGPVLNYGGTVYVPGNNRPVYPMGMTNVTPSRRDIEWLVDRLRSTPTEYVSEPDIIEPPAAAPARIIKRAIRRHPKGGR